MNASEFVAALRSEVQDSAAEETIALLQHPPGKKPAPALVALSQWFNTLSETDRQRVRETVSLAAHQAVFGFLAVLDGVRVIEDGSDRGTLELHYVKAEQLVLLNAPSGPLLHDIFQQR
ncbi:MAG: hypothetical protein WCO56_00525 [Verrucomicrobiota bacterium]